MSKRFTRPVLSRGITSDRHDKPVENNQPPQPEPPVKVVAKTTTLFTSQIPTYHTRACICIVDENLTDSNIEKLYQLRNWISQTFFVFVVNENIEKYSSIPSSLVISIENPTEEKKRNAYVSFILKNKELFDLMIVIDISALRASLIRENFSCLNRDSWDVLFANQSYKYYDIKSLISESCSLYGKEYSEDVKTAIIRKNQYHIPRDAGMIEVKSAFGGLAIYKVELLDEETVYADGHTDFNLQISNKTRRMYIDSTLVLQTPEANSYLYV